jgi:hypothetical protein
MSEAYVGMRPSAAYRCMRSGLIPSELYRTTGVRCDVADGDATALEETVATKPAVSRTAAPAAEKRVIVHLNRHIGM